jgi:hypothetical protein
MTAGIFSTVYCDSISVSLNVCRDPKMTAEAFQHAPFLKFLSKHLCTVLETGLKQPLLYLIPEFSQFFIDFLLKFTLLVH